MRRSTCAFPTGTARLTGAARLQFGETASYGELAGRIGRPGAAQAVGGAMGRNPVPDPDPVPPIIGANRTSAATALYLRDRQGGLAVKRLLLGLEGSTTRD